MGLHDSVELSLARWRFGLSDTVLGESIGLLGFGSNRGDARCIAPEVSFAVFVRDNKSSQRGWYVSVQAAL